LNHQSKDERLGSALFEEDFLVKAVSVNSVLAFGSKLMLLWSGFELEKSTTPLKTGKTALQNSQSVKFDFIVKPLNIKCTHLFITLWSNSGHRSWRLTKKLRLFMLFILFTL